MFIKSLALTAKSTALAPETMLTIILGLPDAPAAAAATAAAEGTGRRAGLLSAGSGRRTGVPPRGTVRPPGPPYSATPLSERSNCQAGSPGVRPAPPRARAAAGCLLVQPG
jgi:hypothetical protein